ncbi:MAG: hypothetical protein ACYDA1_04820, partial [Vulcanimicrobiaceae bacterium]
MIFMIGLIAGLASLWFGCEPWIVTITSRGQQTIPVDWKKIGAIVAGVIIIFSVAPFGGWFGLLISALTNVALFVGIPVAIFMSNTARKGALVRGEQAVVDAQREAEVTENRNLAEQKAKGPVVDLGRAQGILGVRGHASALQAGDCVILSADRLFTGLVCIAPTESGKTACVAQPLAGHWLDDPRAGMFAPGIKRSWSEILIRIAVGAGRKPEQIHRIGPGHSSWPLI